MKKLLLVIAFLSGFVAVEAQQTFSITNSGNTFTPATITITEGDTIQFNQASMHPAREVSLATWNSNGTTSNGGFNNLHSGAKHKFTTAGTYYYVCVNHASSGMKGQIIVNPAATSVKENSINVSLTAYPNPVKENLNLSLTLNRTEDLIVEIYNIIGEKVFSLPKTNYTSGKNNLNIDFTEYSNGAYFVKVLGKDEQYSMKVMK